MDNRNIFNKTVRIANDLEIKKICTEVINSLNENNIRFFKEIENEETILENYLSFKNSILYAIRVDIEYKTKETFTFFDVAVSSNVWQDIQDDNFSIIRFSYVLKDNKLKEVVLDLN